METVLTASTLGLTSRGHDVRILLAGPSEDTRWECGLPVHHLMSDTQFKSTSLSGEILLKVQAMLLQETFGRLPVPDVVVTTGTWVTAVAKAVSDNCENHFRVMSWIHFSLHAVRGKHWLHRADAHIAVSAGIREQLLALNPKIPTHLIYNPVNTSVQFVDRPVTPHFLYIGRLVNRQKRLDRLFAALSGISGDWALTIIGEGTDRSMLEELVRTLGIENRLRWLGWQVHPWSSVTEATALILSSDYEGFGLVLVEALARGIPVISSDCMTGPRDIIDVGENGWLFPLPGENELQEILRSIVEGQTVLPSRESCRASIDRFDIKFFLDSFENAISECIT